MSTAGKEALNQQLRRLSPPAISNLLGPRGRVEVPFQRSEPVVATAVGGPRDQTC